MMEWMPLIMFVLTFAALCLGFPVAFTLSGVSLLFAFFGYYVDLFDLVFIAAIPERLYGIMTNETLIAVPLFVFMGVLLEKTKLSEELLEAMASLFGKRAGGLAISVCIVGALLAASTGIVGATVVTMGLISLPSMLKHKNNPALSSGVICAAGTLGQIIPPSIILVILGDVISNAHQQAQLDAGNFSPDTVSVGDLFMGALIPGLILVSAYILFIALLSKFKPHLFPPLSYSQDEKNSGLIKVIKALIPPLLLILGVLGSIIGGMATPTEAASVGSVGALLLAILKKQFSWSRLKKVMDTTAQVSSMVFVILIGASFFSLVFRGYQGDDLVRSFLLNLRDDVNDLQIDYEYGKREISVHVNKKKAAEAGLNTSEIAYAIRSAYAGTVATSLKNTEEEINIRVAYPEESKRSVKQLRKLLIRNKQGQLIPLRSLAKLKLSKGIVARQHINGRRSITITSDIDTLKTTVLEITNDVMEEFKDLTSQYPHLSIKYGGEYEETQESMADLQTSFLVALFLIAIILITTFKSLTHPFFVMIAIPFGLIGVVIALYIHDEPFSFLTRIGLVGLCGVVINDSIVLVDFIKKLRDQRVPILEAILVGGRKRLRPVLLTTITTLLGLMPTAYGLGGLEPFVAPVALTMSWGLLFATGLTLFLIPSLFFISHDLISTLLRFNAYLIKSIHVKWMRALLKKAYIFTNSLLAS